MQSSSPVWRDERARVSVAVGASREAEAIALIPAGWDAVGWEQLVQSMLDIAPRGTD